VSAGAPELREQMLRLGLAPPSRALGDSVFAYIGELEKWRLRVNLIGNCSPDDLLLFHILEAFWAADRFLGGGETLADIGSGAGFPGLAMKLYRPTLNVALIERTLKKCVFLSATSRRLGLAVSVHNGSAEGWDGWGAVECASVRAVRLGPALLTTLRKAGVSLLHFRGADSEPNLASWRLVREEAFPAGNNRWVGLYRPPENG
jgi:16S rRNA (guanine527-N7)-methyltransferase